MGRNNDTFTLIIDRNRETWSKFRRALRKEDQRAFDELWVYVTKHMMPCTQANHQQPLEVFLFTMIKEEHKEIRRIRRMLEELQLKS